jgi:Flp pilus assembly protein TadD
MWHNTMVLLASFMNKYPHGPAVSGLSTEAEGNDTVPADSKAGRKAGRLLSALWMILIVSVVPGARLGATEGEEGPAGGPVLTVHLKFVIVTETLTTPTTEVGEKEIVQWLGVVNRVFNRYGIRFESRMPADLVVVNDTAAKKEAYSLLRLVQRPDLDKIAPDCKLPNKRLCSIAGKYPDRMVCFLALDPPEVEEQMEYHDVELRPGDRVKLKDGRTGVVTRNIKAQAAIKRRKVSDPLLEYTNMNEGEPRYIVFSCWSGELLGGTLELHACKGLSYMDSQGGTLAHELGHVLGLRHTFSRRFGDVQGACDYISEKGYCATMFDGDGLPDTALDPGIESVRCASPEALFDVCGKEFSVSDNLMSYNYTFARRSSGPSLSPLQVKLVRENAVRLGLDVSGMDAEGLTELLENNPNHQEAHLYRGWRRFRTGDYVSAVADLQAVFSAGSSDIAVMNLLGLSYLFSFDIPKARDIIQQTILVYPESGASRLSGMALSLATGDKAAADAGLGKAGILARNGAEVWRGQTVLPAGVLPSKAPAAVSALGVFHRGLGGNPEIMARFTQALERHERLLEEAVSLYKAGQYQPATDKCAAILAENAWNWKAYQLTGNCRYVQDDTAGARSSYRKSLEINPDNPMLIEFMQKIE